MKNQNLKDNFYSKKINDEDKNGSNFNKPSNDRISVKKTESLNFKPNENTLVLLNNCAKVMIEDFNSTSLFISRSLWRMG
jgi:hypothetical protein